MSAFAGSRQGDHQIYYGVPTRSPKGTESGGDTSAPPEVWSDPAGFQKIAAAATDAATKLAAAAKAGDADEVAADTKLRGEQCGACHKVDPTSKAGLSEPSIAPRAAAIR